jgi:hypothetical protein
MRRNPRGRCDRWHHRDRISIREIERRKSLSRNTIRKYLRSDVVEARFKVPERPSRLDPFADKLSEWLRVEAGQGRKGRRTMRRVWQGMPSFEHLPSLNTWLEARCIERWSELQHGVLPGSVAGVHALEQASLMPVGRAFDGFVEHAKRVSPTCLVHFETN